jgi:outer membrane protein assembly factor BamB
MKSLTLAVFFAGSVVAADWHHYRGPAQDGSTPEKVGTIAQGGPRELWRAQLGTGLSSVTVAGGKVFSAGFKDGKEVLYCLDAANGKTLWTQAWSAKKGDYLFEGGPRATPTVDGQRVYMVGADGHVLCADASSGKPVWTKDLVKDFGGKRMDWGFCASPTIYVEKVLIDAGGPGASTVALKKSDGSTIWKAGDDEPGYGSVFVATVDGKKTAVVFKAGALVGHDAATGKVLWSFPWITDWKVNAATPLLVGDVLVITSAYNHGAAGVRVKGGKAEQVWFNKKLKAQFNSPVERGGYVYGIDGEVGKKSALVCLEGASGDEKWRAPQVKNGSLVLTGDDKLLVLTEAGDLLLADATPSGYRELSRKKVLSDRCWVQPVLANGVIYCRNNQGELVALAAGGK